MTRLSRKYDFRIFPRELDGLSTATLAARVNRRRKCRNAPFDYALITPRPYDNKSPVITFFPEWRNFCVNSLKYITEQPSDPKYLIPSLITLNASRLLNIYDTKLKCANDLRRQVRKTLFRRPNISEIAFCKRRKRVQLSATIFPISPATNNRNYPTRFGFVSYYYGRWGGRFVFFFLV